MEMALVNLVAPGERLLVVSHGFFGDRWEQIAASFGIECDLLRADWGHAVSSAELGARLERQEYAAVAVTHVDTSTGTQAPVADYASLLDGRNEHLILDGVCATAGIDEPFDDTAKRYRSWLGGLIEKCLSNGAVLEPALFLQSRHYGLDRISGNLAAS